MYKINEIFYSLQGEGYHTGKPAIFIRFSGCNLACKWCDTDFHSYIEMSAEDILKKCKEIAPTEAKTIVLTGGEPSLQIDENLLNILHHTGFYICIETNGTNPLPNGIDWITCSPKEDKPPILKQANELKIVYTEQDVETYHQLITAQHYFLQPCSCQNTKQVIDYIMQHPHWQLSIQTHKYLNIR